MATAGGAPLRPPRVPDPRNRLGRDEPALLPPLRVELRSASPPDLPLPALLRLAERCPSANGYVPDEARADIFHNARAPTPYYANFMPRKHPAGLAKQCPARGAYRLPGYVGHAPAITRGLTPVCAVSPQIVHLQRLSYIVEQVSVTRLHRSASARALRPDVCPSWKAAVRLCRRPSSPAASYFGPYPREYS